MGEMALALDRGSRSRMAWATPAEGEGESRPSTKHRASSHTPRSRTRPGPRRGWGPHCHAHARPPGGARDGRPEPHGLLADRLRRDPASDAVLRPRSGLPERRLVPAPATPFQSSARTGAATPRGAGTRLIHEGPRPRSSTAATTHPCSGRFACGQHAGPLGPSPSSGADSGPHVLGRQGLFDLPRRRRRHPFLPPHPRGHGARPLDLPHLPVEQGRQAPRSILTWASRLSSSPCSAARMAPCGVCEWLRATPGREPGRIR